MSINFGGVLDPYAFDENNRDYNKYLKDQNGHLFRLTAASISTNFSITPRKNKTSAKFSKQEIDYINQHPEEYVDFEIPYNLTVSYTYSYSKTGKCANSSITICQLQCGSQSDTTLENRIQQLV